MRRHLCGVRYTPMDRSEAMLSDKDILSRLKNFEDHFVERKRSSDNKREWLQAAVAFANSAPVGYPAVLFIGVKNDGSIEGTANLDSLQRSFSEIMQEAYPPIYYLTRILAQEEKQFLAVIVPGSADRPCFAGPAYVRDGSRTVKASEKQFSELITQRNSKANEILKWKDKMVRAIYVMQGGMMRRKKSRIVHDCNQFYVTLDTECIPLNRIEVSFDQEYDCLRLEIREF